MTKRRVLVWDAPTRLFHWAAVALVAICYATVRLDMMRWHAWAGDALLALLLFRMLWGLFGSDTARFSRFLAAPAAALHHLRRMRQREPDTQLGHNAAGGWMVLLMLLLLFGQTLSGIYVNNEIAEQGPLSELVPEPVANLINLLHDVVLWYALIVLILLHVLAILAYAAIKGHYLLPPMVTGRKYLPENIAAPRMATCRRAIVLLIPSAAAAAAVAVLL
jgi:cytochrome b